jgi:hypothetical protein
MKEFLKRKAVQKVISTVLKIFAIFIMLEFVVFPGLTASDTALNSISAFLGIILIFYTVYLFAYDIWSSDGIHSTVEAELNQIKNKKEENVKND